MSEKFNVILQTIEEKAEKTTLLDIVEFLVLFPLSIGLLLYIFSH